MEMFDNGSEFLRFDCHLHTKKDKEFEYNGDENNFVSNYVEKLVLEGISVGAITNHNKFDYEEYKTIKREANRKKIFILPGVELSIKEGQRSIHMLIIFDPDEWLAEGVDYISRTISSLFLTVCDPGNENICTNNDLCSVIKELNGLNKDYFMICAHVEQDKGFWQECGGPIIMQLAKNPLFKRRVLGFQKARTRNKIQKIHDWMKYDLALVEGSDPKSIDDIGKGDKKTYIKIGEASYAAVKYAITDFENRIVEEPQIITHGYIKEMKWEGGRLSDQIFAPSHELNTLIGIRGSGKSSVLEVLRYALNKEPAQDVEYKNNLVQTVLGAGGKVELTIVDRFSKTYYLTRINGESSTIYDAERNVLNIPVESILKTPLYFGQKDLALTSNGYEYELFNKIIGDTVHSIDEEKDIIQIKLSNDIEKLKALADIPEQIANINSENSILRHQLTIYKEKGLDEKLKKQTSCNSDLARIDSISEWVQELIQSLEDAYLKDGKELLSVDKYISKYNGEIFTELNTFLIQANENIDAVKKDIENLKMSQEGINTVREKFVQKIDSLKDEFAEIKREINDEQVDADSYVSYQKKLSTNYEKKNKLDEILKSKGELCLSIKKGFCDRNKLLLKNYTEYKDAANKINLQQNQISISIEFKSDKKTLKNKLMAYLKGTGLSETKYNDLCNEFEDMPSLVEDYYLNDGKKIKEHCTDAIYAKVMQKIENSYKDMVVDGTPNVINISYHGKPLGKHSLGQRASALILFILTQHDSDVIIVDQPEDDLDNQVIYEELIQTIKREKREMQFIFATHNANIPVLGDAERVVTTEFHEDCSIGLKCGTIDSTATHSDIVNIMEGGTEAFEKRNEIYGAWK